MGYNLKLALTYSERIHAHLHGRHIIVDAIMHNKVVPQMRTDSYPLTVHASYWCSLGLPHNRPHPAVKCYRYASMPIELLLLCTI